MRISKVDSIKVLFVKIKLEDLVAKIQNRKSI